MPRPALRNHNGAGGLFNLTTIVDFFRKRSAAGCPSWSEALRDKIQIQFFHLNQISGSSAEIAMSAKPH